jgi:GNAT superfamily N-acetyltransferase
MAGKSQAKLSLVLSGWFQPTDPGSGSFDGIGRSVRENFASFAPVQVTLEPIGRDAPAVKPLYEDFIREADGPLVYDREGAGIDLDAEIAAGPPTDLAPPNGVLLLARVDGEPAGLGGIRHLDTKIAEVKSMFVAPDYRGSGLGRRILARLDEIALEHGCRAVRLDTSDYLTPAVGLYRSAGYREVPAYNENPKADLWFERPLRRG